MADYTAGRSADESEDYDPYAYDPPTDDEEWEPEESTRPTIKEERLWTFDEMEQIKAVLVNLGHDINDFILVHLGPTSQKRTTHGHLWEHIASKAEPASREDCEAVVQQALETTMCTSRRSLTQTRKGCRRRLPD